MSRDRGTSPNSVSRDRGTSPNYVGDTARVMGLAIAFFGLLAMLAWQEGVFERLEPATRWALACFALGFAAVTWCLDQDVRDYLRARGPFRKAGATSPGAKRPAT